MGCNPAEALCSHLLMSQVLSLTVLLVGGETADQLLLASVALQPRPPRHKAVLWWLLFVPNPVDHAFSLKESCMTRDSPFRSVSFCEGSSDGESY